MNAIEAAALALVGCRFRLHGRDPATGLDCVGVASVATGIAVPTGYAIRGGRIDEIAQFMGARGFAPVAAAIGGDLMLMRTGPGQLHFAVRTAGGMVHADLSLRRVVERPGQPEWEVLGIWRRLS